MSHILRTFSSHQCRKDNGLQALRTLLVLLRNARSALTMKIHFVFYSVAVFAPSASSFVLPSTFVAPSKVVMYVAGDKEHGERKIPMLPAIGESSYGDESLHSLTSSSKEPSLVANKFDIQYTCKICETRNTNRVSRVGAFT